MRMLQKNQLNPALHPIALAPLAPFRGEGLGVRGRGFRLVQRDLIDFNQTKPLTRPPLPEMWRGGGERRVVHLRSRAGQSLVEFALVALVLYMLLAAMLTFGHMLYVAQGLQGAADLAAREMSRTPFRAMNEDMDPPTAVTFEDVTKTVVGSTDNDKFRKTIFDETLLVIDLDQFFLQFPQPANRELSVFQDLLPTLPLLNQQLLPLMIVDRPIIAGRIRRLLRYPGALILRGTPISPPSQSEGSLQGPYLSETQYSPWFVPDLGVRIPLVVRRFPIGTVFVQWIPIVEEIDTEDNPEDNTQPNPDPFSVLSTQRGIVALRLNYPFQSASMSSFRHNPANLNFPFEPTLGRVNLATDTVIELEPLPDGETIVTLPLQVLNPFTRQVNYTGTHGGTYGLGAQGAFGQIVRPYRRVISAQAIYRREIFE